MADGTHKPIEDVKVGDKVIATAPETGEQTAKSVEQDFVHDDTVIDLIVDSEVITTTEDHPFWSVTDQRFERADELSAGENESPRVSWRLGYLEPAPVGTGVST